ncbi:lysine acetyltransferase [Diaporthe eres]|nr:lysine acetyltransferase [Diaporthe eres]
MGSSAAALPSAEHPDLVLTESTRAELQHVWGLHHPMWGPALKAEDYLAREEFLMTVPLAKNGGVTHWILTDRNAPPDNRPIYASCESLRKRALASRLGPDGPVVQDGIAHGIASVFTNPQYRGKGYASRMMKELGPKLAEWSEGRKGPKEDQNQENGTTRSLFSVLYSDIGKTFYAKTGWAAFESTHLCFKPVAAAAGAPPSSKARPLGYHDLAVLCHLDENLLRGKIQQQARGLPSSDKKVCAALVPELDQFLWHLMREDFMTKHIFHKTPAVRGALFGEPGRRIWAVWTRGYYGGLDKIEGNTFHILRFVVEDEASPDDYVAEGFTAIIQIAQAEAAEWRSFDVQMWNPSELLKRAAEGSGLEYELVNREKDSIASLMWYGDEPTETVDWVANEKYAWC